MAKLNAVGRDASVRKYDVLSALMLLGLHGSKADVKLAARLCLLVTTRYNWQRDELTVAQTDIARLWNVDVRTVKRDLAKMRDRVWLVLKRPAARGRVAMYGLSATEILTVSRPLWAAVGPDYVDRAATLLPEERVIHVAFGERGAGEIWPPIATHLAADDAAIYQNWYRHLSFERMEQGVLHLRCATPFVARYIEMHMGDRLIEKVRQIQPDVRVIDICL